MKLLRKFIIGMSMLLADIVLLSCCLYFTVIANKMELVSPNLIVWIGLVAIGFVVNLNVVKRAAHIGPIAIWNVCWMVITAAIVALTFVSEPASIPIKIFVCGVLMVVHGHGVALALLPQRAETCLTFLDILVVVFAIFLVGCHIRQFADVMGMQVMGFVSVGYVLAALIFLRTAEEDVPVVKGDSAIGRAKVFGLLGGIVAASCVACGILSVLANHSAHSLKDIVVLLGQSIKVGAGRLAKLLNTLLSKLPGQDQAAGEIPLAQSGQMAAEQTGAQATAGLPEWVLPLVGVIIIVIVAALVFRLLWKLRHNKVEVRRQTEFRIAVTISTVHEKKISIFQRFLRKWKLRIQMFRERKTPEGLAVLLRKRGKSIGVEMLPDDSWHGYVLRLLSYGDEAALLELSEFFRAYFYGGKRITLSNDQYQLFSQALKKLRKETDV